MRTGDLGVSAMKSSKTVVVFFYESFLRENVFNVAAIFTEKIHTWLISKDYLIWLTQIPKITVCVGCDEWYWSFNIDDKHILKPLTRENFN